MAYSLLFDQRWRILWFDFFCTTSVRLTLCCLIAEIKRLRTLHFIYIVGTGSENVNFIYTNRFVFGAYKQIILRHMTSDDIIIIKVGSHSQHVCLLIDQICHCQHVLDFLSNLGQAWLTLLDQIFSTKRVWGKFPQLCFGLSKGL